MKIIYHKGTGTWFAADEAVIIDTDLLPKDRDIILQLEEEGDHIAEAYAQKIVTTSYRNLIFCDADSIRIEVKGKLESELHHTDEDRDILKWAERLTDSDLNFIGELMMNDDKMWENYDDVLWSALYEAHDRHI